MNKRKPSPEWIRRRESQAGGVFGVELTKSEERGVVEKLNRVAESGGTTEFQDPESFNEMTAGLDAEAEMYFKQQSSNESPGSKSSQTILTVADLRKTIDIAVKGNIVAEVAGKLTRFMGDNGAENN